MLSRVSIINYSYNRIGYIIDYKFITFFNFFFEGYFLRCCFFVFWNSLDLQNTVRASLIQKQFQMIFVGLYRCNFYCVVCLIWRIAIHEIKYLFSLHTIGKISLNQTYRKKIYMFSDLANQRSPRCMSDRYLTLRSS